MSGNIELFRELVESKDTMRIIPTPAFRDTAPPSSQLLRRWDYLKITMMDILIRMTESADISESHPVMSQFISYLSNEKQVIPVDFLLPLERKVISFNQWRQRKANERDTSLIIGSLIVCKVLAQRLFFKPYKIRKFYESTEYLTDETLIQNIPWRELKHTVDDIEESQLFWNACDDEE